ncbi:MAG: biotin/lipoyl-containing protein [Thermodesulfobacteriota bacterium]|nr:biotin/lipoyl-containing protein [Thermodesulfobacteriota bacterium]
MIYPVIVPTFDVNNDFVYLVEWFVKEGEFVNRDEPVCCLDTSKATYDVHAETAGYVKELRYSPGQEVPVQEILCFIVDAMDEDVSSFKMDARDQSFESFVPSKDDYKNAVSSGEALQNRERGPKGRKFFATSNAVKLAGQLDIDLAALGKNGLIRTKDILQYQKEKEEDRQGEDVRAFPGRPETDGGQDGPDASRPSRVVVYGAGDHGILVKEWIDSSATREFYGFLDGKKPAGTFVADGKILGGRSYLGRLRGLQVDEIFVTVFDRRLREELNREARDAGLKLFSIVHPSVILGTHVEIGEGCFIKAGAVIDSHTSIGEGAIIDNGCVIAHHSRIGRYCHLTPGVVTGGRVVVGDYTLVAINSGIMSRVEIGEDCWIDIGSVVKTSFPEKKLYIGGSPARVKYKLK